MHSQCTNIPRPRLLTDLDPLALQSPFIGRNVPLVDNGVPILYPRYSKVEDLLPAAAPGTTNAQAAVAEEQRPAKKAKQDHPPQPEGVIVINGVTYAPVAAASPAAAAAAAPAAQPSPAAAANGAGGTPQAAAGNKSKKEKKKKGQQAAPSPAQLASNGHEADSDDNDDTDGPASAKEGNAEEAQKMRSILGFSQPAAALAPAPVAAAAPQDKPRSAFNFGFAVERKAEAATQVREAGPLNGR